MSTTDSDATWGTAQSAQCGPHSREAVLDGSNAQARARARESSPGTAQPQPDSADTVKLTVGDYAAEVKAWLRATFTPPDVWSTDRAALKKVWAYACRGEWTTPDGALRKAGQVYALAVAFPVMAVCAVIEWTAERFSRLIFAVVLLWLLSSVPPLSWLI